ncbi:MAG: hypothetical protein S4CHLAM6_12170 [Chlamydiae bacterium]|nr:hypothetical protein [Chlamydiota bacterium]
MISIWTKHILKETFKIFLFFILSLYFIYSLIDYSSRIDYYNSLPTLSVFYYYVCVLSQKTELLIPFAFMVTIIKVLTSMNSHNELVSMLMAGRSFKKLLQPLFVFATILSILLYLNFQFLEPQAQKQIQQIKQQKKKSKDTKVKSFVLDDGSKLVFSEYNFSDKSLEKVYWIKNSEKIHYMKKLYPYSSPPIGHFTLEFQKNDASELNLINRCDLKPYHDMQMTFDPLQQSIFSVRTYSITSLIRYLKNPTILLNVDSAELLTLLNYKLVLPLLPIFTLIVLAPICTRFSRGIPTFLIYMGAIIGMLTFFTSMDACYILSENKLIFPQFALWIPFLLFFCYPTKKFIHY